LQVNETAGVVVTGIEEVTDAAEGITAAGMLAGVLVVGCGPHHGDCCMHYK